VPTKEALKFKPKAQWKFVARNARSTTEQHRDGKAESASTSIARHGVRVGRASAGGRRHVKSLDDKAALMVKGVSHGDHRRAERAAAVPESWRPSAVIANTARGRQCRDARSWQCSERRSARKLHQRAFKAAMIEKVQAAAEGGAYLGNVDAEFAKGGKMLEAGVLHADGAHASMEPPAAVRNSGTAKREVWIADAESQAVQDTVAAALGIDKKNVICHVTLLGGAVRTEIQPRLRARKRPCSRGSSQKACEVVWTREDDIHHDFYHATAAVYHKATVDAKGRRRRGCSDRSFRRSSTFGAPGRSLELDMGLDDTLYDVPKHPRGKRPAPTRTSASAGSAPSRTTSAFAAHSFADELAHAANRDTLEFCST